MYLDFKDNIEEDKLKQIALKIKQGEVVVFPTETVYGIGTNCYKEDSIKRIYEVKNRPIDKPISLLVSDYEMIKKVAKEISPLEEKVIKKFMPGPLTIILKKNETISDIVTAGKDTVGVRIPANEIAQKIVKYAGVPIATPSANISGNESGIEIENVIKEFGDKVNYYIDGGKSELSLSSTIIKIDDGKVNILREGKISKKEIEEFIKKY